jgi:V/A-type H+/Na+-transporting ATPase subunit F
VKIAVLTDSDSAAGYRLAGLEVVVAADGPAAQKMLADLVQADVYALIAVNAALVPDPYQVVKREMRGRDFPVMLPIPSIDSAVADRGEDAKVYMRRLIVDTIGYEIRIVDSS